jgi:hypothetical protein
VAGIKGFHLHLTRHTAASWWLAAGGSEGGLMSVVDVATAAGLIKCSKRWLEDQLRANRFPARKIGRRWMPSQEDLDEIVRRCAVAPKPAPPTDATNPAVPQSSSMTRTTALRLRRGDQ